MSAGTSKRTLAVVVLLLASFMDLMDNTIVNVALPAIQGSLQASAPQLQWTVSGYVLSFAAVLIGAGRWGDMIGRRTVFLLGTTGFTAASLLAGLADTGAELVVLRVVQGLFAGLMVPQVLGTVQALYPPQERARVYGIAGAVTGLAAVAGPLLGGVFVSGDVFGLGWRAVFLINIPVGVLVVAGTLAFVPPTKAEDPLQVDIAGVLLAAGGVLALVLPLIEGRQAGWPWWAIALLVIGPILLALFVVHERRRGRHGRTPLLPMTLFSDRGFSAGLIVQLCFQASVIGYLFVLSITVQTGFGFTAWDAGMTVLPFSIAAAITSGAAAALVARLGRALVTVGALLQAAGVAWSIPVIASGGRPTVATLIGPMAIAGAGLGLVVVPLTDVVLAAVPVNDAGSASGALSTFQQVGGALGVTIVATTFFAAAASSPQPGGAFTVAAWVAAALGVAATLGSFALPAARPSAPQAT